MCHIDALPVRGLDIPLSWDSLSNIFDVSFSDHLHCKHSIPSNCSIPEMLKMENWFRKQKLPRFSIKNLQSHNGSSHVSNSVLNPSQPSFPPVRQSLVRDFFPKPHVTEHGDQSVQQLHTPGKSFAFCCWWFYTLNVTLNLPLHEWVLQALAIFEVPSQPPLSQFLVRNCWPPPHSTLHWLHEPQSVQPASSPPSPDRWHEPSEWQILVSSLTDTFKLFASGTLALHEKRKRRSNCPPSPVDPFTCTIHGVQEPILFTSLHCCVLHTS